MIPQKIIYRKNILFVLDQREIPFKTKYFKAKNIADVAKSIRDMMVRGAPLIGATAALGYLLGIDEIIKKNIFDKKRILKILKSNSEKLKSSRPTALSLFEVTDHIHSKATKILSFKSAKLSQKDIKDFRNNIKKCALKILEQDRLSTLKIAENGTKLLKPKSKLITYCNTGSLATYGIGTALGIITYGYKKGMVKFVYPCETRPYFQGARLTSWELLKNNIPSKLICDNMAGWIMKTEKIDAVIIGADRIASNGDTANKIGSYSLSILASFHNIPFYVAAPTNTFDMKIKTGDEIKIEERNPIEVIKIKNVSIAHTNVKARHPAFDIVPSKLITAIITEKGIIKNPNRIKILKHINN